MKKIELTEQEVQSIMNQLETLPMGKVKNIVYFFEGKVRELDTVKSEEPKKKG